MRTKPWVTKYWRMYRFHRKRGFTVKQSRRLAGIIASQWWDYTSNWKEGDSDNMVALIMKGLMNND